MPVGDAVVELQLRVRVEEPVQAQRDVVQDASIDPLVVEVQVVVAEPNLPCSPAVLVGLAVLAFDPKRVLARHDAIVEARLADVGPVLAGQEVQDLDVAARVEERPHARLALPVCPTQERILVEVEVVFRIDRPRPEHIDGLEVDILLTAARVEGPGIGVIGPIRGNAGALRAAHPEAARAVVVATIAARDAQVHDLTPFILVK